MPHQLLPFLLVVLVLTVTPGPDMVLVLRNGVRGGARLAWWTGLGCCAGIAVHATAAVVGLAAVLAASATAYTVVRLVGAAYLVFLGASALWSVRPRARRSTVQLTPDQAQPLVTEPLLTDPLVTAPAAAEPLVTAPTVAGPTASTPTAGTPTSGAPVQPEPPALTRGTAFRQGVLSNLLNPKIALLFLTLLPQFVTPEEPRLATSAVLALVFLGLAVLWWRVFSLVVAVLGRVLSAQRVRTALEWATGLVLITLGLRVALDG
ncbi:LysE family translocator [Goodfellowiella coeruleoviolacea]|uniref:LysE type translocator n=1 Tax=Goodfellowiella coeruleoviolacea TaxID=334858 RepID=A0AAE3GFW0_9PSEU|nr:LysE family transporter [Goodfellowiella coeruleoviolacea]MCP2166953.1 LysE type translocator [Goodfellowiella coeruleoviolacea]